MHNNNSDNIEIMIGYATNKIIEEILIKYWIGIKKVWKNLSQIAILCFTMLMDDITRVIK